MKKIFSQSMTEPPVAVSSSVATGKPNIEEVQSRMSERARTAPVFNEQDAIFERMILIIPYKAPETVQQIEQSFERINMAGLGLDNNRYLNTKEFN